MPVTPSERPRVIPGEDWFCMDCRILPCYPLADVLSHVDAICRDIEKEYGVQIEYTAPQKSETGENEIIVNGGANVLLNNEDIDNNIDLIKDSDIILLQLEINIEVIKHIIEIAKKYNKIVVLNPAPFKALDDYILSNLDYITPNETEIEKLSHYNDLDKDINILLNKGVKNVIVTLGNKGSKIVNKDYCKTIKSYKVNAIDTTGAGDCYNGTFVGYLAKGFNLIEALEYASKASAISVTRHGAAASYPSEDEIKADL